MIAGKLRTIHYQKHLYPDEKVLLITERHYISRLPIHIMFIVATLVTGVGTFAVFYTLGVLSVLVGVLCGLGSIAAIAAYFLAWNLLLERQGLVFTDQRLMIFEHDIFSRSHRIIPYERIEEATVRENFFGHIFGYGDVHLVIHEEEDTALFKGYTGLVELERIVSKYLGPKSHEGFPAWKL